MKNIKIFPIFLCALVFILSACSESDDLRNNKGILAKAESFIDAFYSFDPVELRAFLSKAEESAPSIIYYQGWAKGGNYKVLNRKPCEISDLNSVKCSITVEDDPILALGIDFKVTRLLEPAVLAVGIKGKTGENALRKLDISAKSQPSNNRIKAVLKFGPVFI